jgi:hypothetical protein
MGMNIEEETILSAETLNRLWSYWAMKNIPHKPSIFFKYRNYQDRYRHGFNECIFEDWLWRNGFTVIQEYKIRFLKHSGDSRKLTVFLLKCC